MVDAGTRTLETRPRRSVRPAFAKLGRALRSIRQLQALFLVLVLASAWNTLGLILLVTDPLGGDRALLEALLSLALTLLLVIGGTRLAFEPFRWSLALALVWSAWAASRLLAGVVPENVLVGLLLWVCTVRALPYARLAHEHPNTYSVRRVAVLQGRSGERVADAEQDQSQRLQGSRKAWRQGRRTAATIGVLGLVGLLGARLLRPESPASLAERFRSAWNAGEQVLTERFSVAVDGLNDVGRAWPELGTLELTASDDGPRAFRSRRAFNDPRVPDRELALVFSLADGSGTVGALFDWDDGGWRASRVQLLSPDLIPVVRTFAEAWSASDAAGLLTLASSRREAVEGDLERVNEQLGTSLPSLGPAMTRLHASGFQCAQPCGRGWLVTNWGREGDGPWELMGLWYSNQR
jgi:hypothetical protein